MSSNIIIKDIPIIVTDGNIQSNACNHSHAMITEITRSFIYTWCTCTSITSVISSSDTRAWINATKSRTIICAVVNIIVSSTFIEYQSAYLRNMDYVCKGNIIYVYEVNIICHYLYFNNLNYINIVHIRIIMCMCSLKCYSLK